MKGGGRKRHFARCRRKHIDVRPATDADMKYIWAAYKLNAMEALSPVFGADMDFNDFKELFIETVNESGNVVWTMVAPVPGKDPMPVGIAYGLVRDRVIHDLHAIWFPWATKRTVFETAKEFFEKTRREFFVKIFVDETVERFFDAIVSTGALKKGNRFYGLYPGKAAIFYYAKV